MLFTVGNVVEYLTGKRGCTIIQEVDGRTFLKHANLDPIKPVMVCENGTGAKAFSLGTIEATNWKSLERQLDKANVKK